MKRIPGLLSGAKKSMEPFTVAFFLINLLLSSFFIDTWLTPNPGSRALTVHSIVVDGRLSFDRYHGVTLDKSFIDGH
ncbi:MAG: hypothetical protein JEZ11_02885 [Desulfobacterales bacterium]|nr:hypothetical protein [Desulfobacterales bacterium]